MALLSIHAQANATELLSETRKKGPRYQRWSAREEQIVEVQGLMGKTVTEIQNRLAKDGYHRTTQSITSLLRKLKVSAKSGASMKLFATK